MLGVPISDEYEKVVRKKVQTAVQVRKQKKADKKKNEYDDDPDCDEIFKFIAGYTPAGFPYGITWKEWEELESQDPGSYPN